MKVMWWQRNYVIEPKLQLKIVGFLASVSLVMAGLIIWTASSKINELGVFFNRSLLIHAPTMNPFKDLACSIQLALAGIGISFVVVVIGIIKIIAEKKLSFLWLALSMIVCMCLIFSAAYMGKTYMKVSQMGTPASTAPPVIMPVAKEEAFQLIATSLMFNLSSIVTFMIMIFSGAGIILTHRVAGPIWRLQTELRKLMSGQEIRPLKFRKNDEFHELAELINILIERSKK